MKLHRKHSKKVREVPDAYHVLSDYGKYTGRKTLFIIVTLAGLFLTAIIALALGPAKLSLSEVINALLGNADGSANTIVWNIRMPRIVTAIVGGMGLAVCGAVMQSILRNPLASPFTLGVSHAATFGAAFAIVVLGYGTMQSDSSDAVIINTPYLLVLCSFGFTLISTLIIVLLAKLKKASPETMILAGVAIGSLFIAGTTALQYFAKDDVQLSAIVFWTFGDVSRTSWTQTALITIVVIITTAYFYLNRWNYNAMDGGEEVAKSLGVNVGRVRTGSLIVASVVTATIVSFIGIIGFICLVVPHIVRRIIGGDARFLIPASCIVGALLLLISDTVARTVISPVVLPVGIITSFFGAPLFIYLIIKGREYW